VDDMNGDDEQRSNPEEQAIKDLERAEKDLQKAEQEVLDAERELERIHENVTINVNGKEFRVHGGDWVVQELKKQVEVDPSQVLAEITPKGLKDLGDNEVIKVQQDERFMSHARSGASS
jgi:hypothetical protein